MLKGYKTIIVNAAVVVFMMLSFIWPDAPLPNPDDVGEVVDKADELITDAVALWATVLALVNMLLRAVTKTPIFDRGGFLSFSKMESDDVDI